VAGFAFGAVSTGMNILQPVARDAGRGEILVTFARMTGGATDILVGAVEGEFRLAMVEWLDSGPADLAVAAIARLAEASLVRIALLVTVEAPSGRAAKGDRGRMATAALRGSVCTLELEVRRGVIERLPIKLDDVGISPLVFGVAVPAILAQGIGLAPVKSFSLLAVCSNVVVVVASDAKTTLRLPGERRVAAAALLLELGVSRDQRARHDQRLEDILRLRGPREGPGDRPKDRDGADRAQCDRLYKAPFQRPISINTNARR